MEEHSSSVRAAISDESSPEPASLPKRLRGRSPEEAREVGTQLYYPHQLQIRGAGAQFSMAATTTAIGPLSIGTLKYSVPVTIETGPYESAYQVNIAQRGTIATSAGNRSIVSTRSLGAVYGPTVDTALRGWDTPCTMFTVKIDRVEFERIISAYLGIEISRPVDFSLPLAVDTVNGAAWMGAVNRLARLSTVVADLPLLAEHLTEQVVVGLLWTADSSLQNHLHGIAPANVSAVRRGIDLIRAIPGESLTLDIIADYAGVSGRSLQLAFRDELGISPMQYLKAVRLDRVAETLRDSSASNVAETARRFGFHHLGRFASEYQARHGEKPSETRSRRLL